MTEFQDNSQNEEFELEKKKLKVDLEKKDLGESGVEESRIAQSLDGPRASNEVEDVGRDLDLPLDEPSEDKALSDSPELFQFPGSPLVVPREQHNISRSLIDRDALKVMYRLIKGGYKAFLVGGGVRDLLLGKRPKDFDIGTSAKPEEVRMLFRNSRIIGRRFRMNQVYFRGGKIIEVATFRAQTETPQGEEEPKMLAPDNTYGDEQSDALRRDLTINGLFYDPNSYAVIDYVGGMEDLKNKVIRIIGDPDKRFREDPVRMIRAVRHAARTGFEIERVTKDSIEDNAALIAKVVKARVYEEFTRDVRTGYSRLAVPMLQELGLLPYLLPQLARTYSGQGVSEQEKSELLSLLENTLQRLDAVVTSGREVPVSVSFLALCIDSFAVVKPEPAQRLSERLRSVIGEVYADIGVTKRDREDMESIILLAHQLFNGCRLPADKLRVLKKKPLIREALLLLELTVNNEDGQKCLEFWNEFLEQEPLEAARERRPAYRRDNNRRRRRRR